MELTVLPNAPAASHPPASPPQPNLTEALYEAAPALVAALGDPARLRTGRHHRLLYATDASMYQVEPLAVVIPPDAAAVERVAAVCYQHALPMLPRGGGTSLAGQCTAPAVVIDTSAFCQTISDLDVPARTVHAQSGVKLDDLNAWLAARNSGLFYAPDPATTAQATIGGTIGNNASGSRSVFYGRTVDSILQIDAVLSSGARVTFGPGAGHPSPGRSSPVALKLADHLAGIVRRNERLIRDKFPKTLRRNAGYALDLILHQLDAGLTPHDLDLTKLLCGSEGTLAITLGAKLKLFPVPRAKGLALVSFRSVDDAIACVPGILTTRPSAVELVDDVVIGAARNNRECSPYVDAFPRIDGADPAAVLYVEYHCASADELIARLTDLPRHLASGVMRSVTDAPGMADAWKLRKAGEPLLHGIPGKRHPLTFVEDNAVPVENLAQFVREFREIVTRAGTRAAFWAHASVGVLHVRPMLDPHDPADKARLVDIAEQVADLAQRLGGVMSGEHGDGKVRGPLLERFYGPELMRAFREVKALFDPRNLLNPGNITQPGPTASIVQRTRIEPQPDVPGPVVPPVSTYFTYDDQHGFASAVEMCNGAGVCRKSSGGTMCPSYRATMDERHATRGRGNALRLAITGQALAPGQDDTPQARFSDQGTIDTLDLCLSCKACKTECPSNVDISRLKAEYTAQRYTATGRIPLSALLIGHVRAINRLGALTPDLANWVNTLPPMRALINAVMAMHPRRSMPRFSRSLYSLWPAESSSSQPATQAISAAPAVALFADCFTTYNESHIGLAVRSALTKLGYRVHLPRHGCCGRSMISVGMLPQAIATADATLQSLLPLITDPSVRAIVVAEPSCLSAIKDDWLQLQLQTPLHIRKALAAKAMLPEEFIERFWDAHPVAPKPVSADRWPQVLLHAHCHQKALWGAGSSGKVLRRLLGDRLTVLDTGCCGMAGSFGYHRDKFDLSMQIANLQGVDGPTHAGGGVLPHLRRAPDAAVLAPGTSCRHQIHDGTAGARHALHPIELLDQILA
ncbi:MAG: FAD-binding and (Fe-S)-binding domain-containing protein [bacterium]